MVPAGEKIKFFKFYDNKKERRVEALIYMFKDSKLWQKALMYFTFLYLGVFCTDSAKILAGPNADLAYIWIFLAGIVLMCIPYGYFALCVKGLAEQKTNFVLPAFSLKTAFTAGVKYSIALFLIMILYGALCLFGTLLFYAVSIFSVAKLPPLCSYISIVLGCAILALLIIVPFLLFCVYAVAFNWIFANTHSLLSFFQFKKATKLIKQNVSLYAKAFGIFIAVTIVIGCIGLILHDLLTGLCGLALYTFLTVLLSTYGMFINAFLTAKAIEPQEDL